MVEDEWLPRMDMADALTAVGWDVVEFASGEQALAYLAGGPAVQLLITDIRLGGSITGWEVALAFRARNAELTVVYCSGNPHDAGKQVPGSTFMAKPCPVDRLLAVCGRPGEERRA